jgi:hypothetical protein
MERARERLAAHQMLRRAKGGGAQREVAAQKPAVFVTKLLPDTNL